VRNTLGLAGFGVNGLMMKKLSRWICEGIEIELLQTFFQDLVCFLCCNLRGTGGRVRAPHRHRVGKCRSDQWFRNLCSDAISAA